MAIIKFNEYLSEGRLAPLYHGTSWKAFRNIIYEKQIWPTSIHVMSKLMMAKPKDGSNSYRGVSTTRSLKLAKRFRDGELEKSEGSVVFELNQMKITHRYRIVPIQYFDGPSRRKEIPTSADGSTRNEYEEFIVSSSAVPLTLATAIHIPRGYRNEVDDDEKEISEKLGLIINYY
jgi:hypothetical protein